VFKIGEKIVYPMHGAGIVEAIEKKLISDREIDYYKVKIFSGNIMLMLPVNNTAGVQLRHVISKDEAEQVIDGFDCLKPESEIPWNKRYKDNVDKLKTGIAQNVAQVLNDLILREKNHGLSTSDRKMFILSKSILCSELNAALETDTSEIFEQILNKF